MIQDMGDDGLLQREQIILKQKNDLDILGKHLHMEILRKAKGHV